MDSFFTYKDENSEQAMQPLPQNGDYDNSGDIDSVQMPPSAQCAVEKQVIKPFSVQQEEKASYTQGYLKQQQGKTVCIYSLIGNELKEHKGKLKKVGANFLVLGEGSEEQMLCDYSAIKFIKIQ